MYSGRLHAHFLPLAWNLSPLIAAPADAVATDRCRWPQHLGGILGLGRAMLLRQLKQTGGNSYYWNWFWEGSACF